jgi:hypothetical protein
MALALQAMTVARHQWPMPTSLPEARPVRPVSEPSAPVDLELLRKAVADYVAASETGRHIVW